MSLSHTGASMLEERRNSLMNTISRRSVVRSTSVLFALPFAGALAPAYASGLAEVGGASQPGRVKFSKTAATSVSLDLVNFVKDHAARVVAAHYQGTHGDYSALGDQFHLLGKQLSSAGADKAVKAYSKKLLKTGTIPTLDPQAVGHAVSCVKAYAPSYSASDLLANNGFPRTPQEWAVYLKKLKKHGVVKYMHQSGRLLNAMGRASRNEPVDVAQVGSAGSYQAAVFGLNNSTQAAHVVEICSLSQKAKFFACLGLVTLAALAVVAAVAAICGATGIVTCVGGAISASATVGFAVAVAGLWLVYGAAITACSVYLSSYHKEARPQAALSAI
jgi:hypothetical protein